MGAKQLLEVALDEDDVGAGTPARPDGPRPWWARHPRALAGGAAVALAVALAGAQLVVDARERDRAEAFGDLPGVVSDLSAPPRLPADAATQAVGARPHDEEVVAQDGAAPRVVVRTAVPELTASVPAVTLVGLDADDVVWSYPLLDASGRDDVPRTWPTCLPTPGEPATVTCLVDEDGGPDGSLLVALAVADGRLVRQTELDAPAPADVVAAGGLLVEVVRRQDEVDGSVAVDVVRAHDPVTWDVRWSRQIPAGVADRGFVGGPRLRASPELVVVDVVTSVTVLSGRDGRLLRGPDGSALTGWVAADEGPVDVLALGVDGGTELWTPDGSVVVEGQLLTPSVDDGSLGDLVLTTVGHDLVASDLDGTRRWRAEGGGGWDVMVVDEHLVVLGTSELSGVEGSSGRVLWTAEVAEGATLAATDGTRVLVHENDLVVGGTATPERGVDLVAHDLADGEAVWRTTLVGLTGVDVVDGHLVGGVAGGATLDLG